MATASSSTAPQPYLLPGQPLPSSPELASSVPSSGTYRRSTYTLSSLIGQASVSKPASTRKSSAKPAHARVHNRFAQLHRLPEPDSVVLARITRITSRQATCSILLVLPDQGRSSSSSDQDASGLFSASLSLSQSLASGRANHAAGEDPSGLDFNGIIRQQDVRLTETDKVRIADCFRVGDLVKAKVVSLGDSRSYYLTTASNELGVLFATATPSSDVLTSEATSLLPAAFQSSPATEKPAPSSSAPASIPGALQPLDWQTMVDPITGRKERRKVAKPEDL